MKKLLYMLRERLCNLLNDIMCCKMNYIYTDITSEGETYTLDERGIYVFNLTKTISGNLGSLPRICLNKSALDVGEFMIVIFKVHTSPGNLTGLIRIPYDNQILPLNYGEKRTHNGENIVTYSFSYGTACKLIILRTTETNYIIDKT